MHDYSLEEPAPSPFTATYIAHTIRSYRTAIGLIVLAVVVGYLILAMTAYLLAPAVRLTSLNFRLEFSGAEKGEYPNGLKFSSSEIIATQVLLKTFRENDLKRFTKFNSFVGSVFVVESNEAREALAREYQARLADTRLTSIDRERIQREYELKTASLSKNQFSINYVRRRRDAMPDIVAKKVLHDILKNWAEYAAKEQHVLEYRVSVLSPDVVAPETRETGNAIVTTVILRGNVLRLLNNIRQVRGLPNAELRRTADGLSLDDIAIRLEDLVRYRLDPLVDRVAAARLDNRAETIRFLSTQLAYDERNLEWRRSVAAAAQRTLTLFVSAQPQPTGLPATVPSAEPAAKSGESETVMPQISDTFLDRLIQLTSRSADTEYRRRKADEFQNASLAVGPAEAAVAYDNSVLEIVRSTSGPAVPVDPEEVAREIEAARKNVRQLAVKVQELHKVISENLNPATELVTAATPRTRVSRGISLTMIIVGGFLITLVSLVAAVLLSFFHSRVREGEDEAAGVATPAESTT